MNPNTNIESEFGFEEYIMPSNAPSTFMSKVESFDAQLYPSGTKLCCSQFFILMRK